MHRDLRSNAAWIGLCIVCLLAWCVWGGAGCERRSPAAGPGPTFGPKATANVETLRLAPASPALAVILRDLGLGERVVARHGFDTHSPRELAVIGSQDGLDYEALLRVRPTHVLLEWGSKRPMPPRLVELASAQGWVVSNHTLLTLEDIRRTTLELRERFPVSVSGAVEGMEAPTREELEARFDRAWRPRGGARGGARGEKEGVALSRAGKVLLMAGVDPPSFFGPGSCHHQVLERLGATPAIREGSAWVTLDAEAVLHLAPDAIVAILPRAAGSAAEAKATAAEVAAMLGRVGTLEIPAVRRGRLALIDDPLCQTPATSMIGFADQLDAVLRAWAEEDAAPDNAGDTMAPR